MNVPLHIAKRYLFAKKSHNAINIISGISVVGVIIGTMGLIIVLSVFNGFDKLIKSLNDSFDPDLKVSIVEGKTFEVSDAQLKKLTAIKGVAKWSKVIEENALLKYGEKQFIATIKGVDENYLKINHLDTMIIDGKPLLQDEHNYYAIVGQGIAYNLQIGLKFITPIIVYMPRKMASISSLDPTNAYTQKYLFPSGVFAIDADHDSKYVVVPLKFAFSLLDDSTKISAIEIKTDANASIDQTQLAVQNLFGSAFYVKNRNQQQEAFYKIMKIEKWTIFLILAFILIIASFNIIGSISTLIIEKKNDIVTLYNLGATNQFINRIFLFEGLMISFLGAIIGLILGLLVCWLQIHYGFVKLQGSGTFIIDAYPVAIELNDIFTVFFTVILIGYIVALLPAKYIIRNYLPNNPLKK